MNLDWLEATEAVQAMVAAFIERLPYFGLAVLCFGFFFFLAKGIRAGVKSAARRINKHQNLGMVLGRLSFGLVILLGLLIALVIAIPGFTMGKLVSILGLSSVAIGFAFRDILQNFLAGILILLFHPFRIGDQIIVGKYEGTVENIETRATYIKTYDGRRVVIPNSKLFTDPVTVNTANQKRRLQYDVGIGVGDDIAHAKRIMLEAVQSAAGVLDDPPPDAIVVDLAASSVKVRLRWWIHPPRQIDVLHAQDAVLEQVKNALTDAGVDLPYPTYQVLFHDQTEETDGDRSRQREGWPSGGKKAPRQLRLVDALTLLRR